MQELEKEIADNEQDLDEIMKDIPTHKHDTNDNVSNEKDDNVSNEQIDNDNGGWKGIYLLFIQVFFIPICVIF